MNEYGEVCERCGTSELGATRTKELGFKRKPCTKCPESVRRILEAS